MLTPNGPFARQQEELASIYARKAEAFGVPRAPAEGAELGRCHANAAAFCSTNPGHSVVTGWIVMPMGLDHYWFCPHSVVRDGSGKLLDVTPQHDDRVVIKFLPDDSSLLRHGIENGIGHFPYPPFPVATIVDVMGMANPDEEEF
jgi:hypothetical protein